MPALDASDLNLASIAIGDLAGSQTVTRTATSVGSQSETYTFSVSGLTGITVTPSVGYVHGCSGLGDAVRGLVPPDDGADQRLPAGPRHLDRRQGSRRADARRDPPGRHRGSGRGERHGRHLNWTAKTGYTGTLNAVARGPVPATVSTFTLAQDPDATFDPADPTGTFKKDVAVPAGAIFRAGIYEDAITPTGTDLDLYVYLGSTLVGVSADGDSNEEVTLRAGASPLTLTVYVHGWSTNGPSAEVTLFDWVANAATGDMTVSPATTPVTTGSTVSYTATFSGLAPATRYFGAVDYNNGTARIGQTFVSVQHAVGSLSAESSARGRRRRPLVVSPSRLRRCPADVAGRSSSSVSSARPRSSPPRTATSAPRSTTRSASRPSTRSG